MRVSQHLRGRLVLRPAVLARARRDFTPGAGPAGRRLDEVVESFAHGYNRALAGTFDPAETPPALRGFAYEGAAMSATIVDLLTVSGGRRLNELAAGDGARYVHLINVGAGWAFARLRLRPWRGVRRGPGLGPPLLASLAWDGWGFHRAFFAPARVFTGKRRGPRSAAAVVDQGAGRALWFYAGADPGRVTEVIAGFPPARRADLWAGIGLAAAYTGAQPPEVLADLVRGAGDDAAHLAQGAAFAAKAHLLAALAPAPEVGSAVTALTGAPADVAARWTDDALAPAESYEQWRAGIRRAWKRERQTI